MDDIYDAQFHLTVVPPLIETFVAMLKRGETIYPQGRKEAKQ